MTGGGLLVCAMRPEVVEGDFGPDVVSNQAPALAGGAWLDAPDFLPAGSTVRDEIWHGTIGAAYAMPSQALRS